MRSGYWYRLTMATCAGIIVGSALLVWDHRFSSRQVSQTETALVEPLLPIEAEHTPEGTPETHIFDSIEEARDKCPEQRYAVLSSVLETSLETPEQYACVY